MKNDPRYNSLREASWRRKLSLAEESELRAWLVAHPKAQEDWEIETGLTDALGCLPDALVSTNFTARVLQAVEQEAAAQSGAQTRTWRGWLSRVRWVPRVAFALIALGVGFGSYRLTRDVQRDQMLDGVVVVSKVSSLPSHDILQDFDAIRALNRPPPADMQLLSLLNE